MTFVEPGEYPLLQLGRFFDKQYDTAQDEAQSYLVRSLMPHLVFRKHTFAFAAGTLPDGERGNCHDYRQAQGH